MERVVTARPERLARAAGIFFLLEALPAVFAQFAVLGRLVVPGDAAATATNMLAHETLYRMGFAAAIVAVVAHVAWALCTHEMLRWVSPIVSRFALLVVLVGCAMQALAALFLAAPLVVLGNAEVSGAAGSGQTYDLVTLLLRLNAQAFNLHMVFFGAWCLGVGWLIARSTFLPRLIGRLMMIAGAGYLTLIWPPLAQLLHPFNMAIAAPGEVSMLFWLLFKGVDVEAWNRTVKVEAPSHR